MDIDTDAAIKFGFLIFFILMVAIVLTVFYPDDFSIFDRTLVINPLTFDTAQIAIWIAAITIGAAIGFFTSGDAMKVAITGILLGFIGLIFPLFLYILDIMTFGLANYPNYQIHQEMPLILILIIAIPITAVFFIVALDLVSSALHGQSAGD